MATSVIINSKTQNNKQLQRSITHVDPSATSEEIVAFANGLNGLTTNTLTDIRRVETTDLLNDTRLDRNLALDKTTIPVSTIGGIDDPYIVAVTGLGFTYADLKISFSQNSAGIFVSAYNLSTDNSTWIALVADSQSFTGETITIEVAGDNTYKPASVMLTITE